MFPNYESRSRTSGSCWKQLLIGLVITLLVVQYVHCEADATTEASKKPAQDKPKPVKVRKTKPEYTKPVIIMAEKVESPQNWNSWTPVPQNSTSWVNVAPSTTTTTTVAPTPLSLEEQQKWVVRQQIQQEKQKHTHYTKPTAKKPLPTNKGKVPPAPMENLKKQAMHFGKMLFSSIVGTSLGQSGELARLAAVVSDSANWRSSKSTVADSETGESKDSYDSDSYGSHGSESGGGGMGRSALNWLSRLIGVEGKTLGEFLREYQVHVLYDLVFIFFKWIFFVYAGLLIP